MIFKYYLIYLWILIYKIGYFKRKNFFENIDKKKIIQFK